jgi:adenylylsulfate kinase-like enzyme
MMLQVIFYIVSPFGQDGFALLHGDVIRRDLTAAAGIKRNDRDNRKRRSGSK